MKKRKQRPGAGFWPNDLIPAEAPSRAEEVLREQLNLAAAREASLMALIKELAKCLVDTTRDVSPGGTGGA